MKFNLAILVTALFLLSACQKDSSPKDPGNEKAPKADSEANQKSNQTLKVKTKCVSKEVVKFISKEDGSIKRETYDMFSEKLSTSTLISKVGNKKTYESFGEYYSENYITENDGPKSLTRKIDYTYKRNSESEIASLGDNKFKAMMKIKTEKTGRNGYQFSLPDKTKSDTATSILDIVQSYFDDGATSYMISEIINGKVSDVNTLEITKYETTGNITKSVTTYKTPRVIKDTDGVVIEESEFYEVVCTDEKL